MTGPPEAFLARLLAALLAAFPSRGELRRLVQFGLNANLDAISDADSLRDTGFALLTWAQAQGRLAELVQAALRENPGNPALQEVARDLGALGPGPAEPPATRPPACPYPGMLPFGPAGARVFFGREAEIQHMLQHLDGQRFLLVVGPSGSGKSSLVLAGLLPRLPGSALWPAGFWHAITMRPGPEPAARLATALGGDLAHPEPVVAALLAAHAPAGRVLLVVDQFEEIFTLTDRNEQSRFISALSALRMLPSVAVVLTMSADFYPDLMDSVMWPVGPEQRLEVVALQGAALREAIQRPAGASGVAVEEVLVTQLLADAAGEPGRLPLLQETLRLLWAEMPGRQLSLRSYAQLGRGGQSGLAVTLAKMADAALAGLPPAQRELARRIFLRLVQLGDERDTRRQQTEAALATVGVAPALLAQTLDYLTAHRLLTRSGSATPGAPPTVDLSHERLLVDWPTLRGWIAERRSAIQTRDRLEAKAAEWVRLGRGPAGLLDAVEVAEATRWLAGPEAADLGTHPDLPALVARSEAALDAARNARLRLEQRARRAWTALALLAAALALALLALFVGLPLARRWQAAGPVVTITPGAARIGLPAGTACSSDCADEQPQVAVTFTVPFYLNRYEVANRQYRLCWDDHACTTPQDPAARMHFNDPDQFGLFPVTGVSAAQAFAFCAWIGRRLPTELEWERAVHGRGGRYWPWGDATPNASLATMPGPGATPADTQPVTSTPDGASDEGVLNLIGNVSEWTASYADNPYSQYDPARVWASGQITDLTPGPLIIRGGSWEARLQRPTERPQQTWYTTTPELGFRCAYGGAPPQVGP